MITNWRKYIQDYITKERMKFHLKPSIHLHHSGYTFAEIVEMFCWWENISIYKELTPAEATRFIAYHQQICILVPLTTHDHQTLHGHREDKSWLNKY